MTENSGHANIIGKGFHITPQNINLNGKPKGARNRATIYREHLEKMGRSGQVVDDVAIAAIEKALLGDVPAIKEVFDSAYGKMPEKVITAETNANNIDPEITDEIMKYIPQDVLERLATLPSVLLDVDPLNLEENASKDGETAPKG